MHDLLSGAYLLLFVHPWVVAWLFGTPLAAAGFLVVLDYLLPEPDLADERGGDTVGNIAAVTALLILIALAVLAIGSSVTHVPQ